MLLLLEFCCRDCPYIATCLTHSLLLLSYSGPHCAPIIMYPSLNMPLKGCMMLPKTALRNRQQQRAADSKVQVGT